MVEQKKNLRRLPKKTLHRMMKARDESLADVTESFKKLEAKAQALRQERRDLFTALHHECPWCGGKSVVRVSGGYDSSSYHEPCPYKLTWLTGAEDPPEDWKNYCTFFYR